MTTPQLAAQAVFLLACLIILFRTEPVINRMGENTPPLIRIAFLLLVIGSASGVLFTLLGQVPDWLTIIFALGVAALLFCERRIRVLTRIRPKPPQNKGISHA